MSEPTRVRQLGAIVALPGMVVVAIPALLLAASGGPRVGWVGGGPLAWLLVGAGAAGFGVGLWLWAQTTRQLARQGRGTLAPWDPTRRLVVDGVYRRVRNPMISGVAAMLGGEVLALGAWALVGWCAAFVVANAIYIPLVEERGLVRRFGADYDRYRHHVPRWIPRRRPWDGTDGAR